MQVRGDLKAQRGTFEDIYWHEMEPQKDTHVCF